MERNYAAYNNLTIHTCLIYKLFICNGGVEYSVLFSEEYLQWKFRSIFALCEECDGKETYASLKNCTEEVAIVDDRVDEDDIESFATHYASRDFLSVEIHHIFHSYFFCF